MGFGPPFAIYITVKKTLGEIMKCFESSVLVKEMAKIVLLPCHVTHGVPHLFRKTLYPFLFIAKMAKLGFAPTLALNRGRKDSLRDKKTIQGPVIYMANSTLLPCQVTHDCRSLFPIIGLFPLFMAIWQNWVLGQP